MIDPAARAASPASASCPVSAKGLDAHWQKLNAGEGPSSDDKNFAPFLVHPICRSISTSKFRKRATSARWRLGSASAPTPPGLRSTAPGVKGNAELLSRTDMIVAAGGGERDLAADSAILSGVARAANPDALLNERLMSDIRPTLFLAQLSNLLAGNISIVHGVTGSSRTFMGEEAAGSTRCVSRSRASMPARPTSRWSAAPTMANARTSAALCLRRRLLGSSRKPVWERGPQAAAWCSARSAHSWSRSRAPCRRRAAQTLRALPPCCRSAAAANMATVAPTLRKMWARCAASDGRRAPFSPARAAPSRRPPGNARFSQNTPIFPCAPPAPILATGWNRHFR